MWNEVKGIAGSWELVGSTLYPLWPYLKEDVVKFQGTDLLFADNPWLDTPVKPGKEGIVILLNDEEVKIVHKPTSTMYYDRATKMVSVTTDFKSSSISISTDYDGPSGMVEFSLADHKVLRRADGKMPNMGATVLTPTYSQVANMISCKKVELSSSLVDIDTIERFKLYMVMKRK